MTQKARKRPERALCGGETLSKPLGRRNCFLGVLSLDDDR